MPTFSLTSSPFNDAHYISTIDLSSPWMVRSEPPMIFIAPRSDGWVLISHWVDDPGFPRCFRYIHNFYFINHWVDDPHSFQTWILLRIILCGRFADSRTHMSSWVSLKCTPIFRYLHNEPIFIILSDSSQVRGLAESQTDMSSQVSSKWTPNFHYLHNEPYL